MGTISLCPEDLRTYSETSGRQIVPPRLLECAVRRVGEVRQARGLKGAAIGILPEARLCAGRGTLLDSNAPLNDARSISFQSIYLALALVVAVAHSSADKNAVVNAVTEE